MQKDFQIVSLLKQISDKDVSDIHFRAGKSPSLRISGKIVKTNIPPLTENDISVILGVIVHKDKLDELIKKDDCDFIYEIPGVSRFRVNFCKDLGLPKITMRLVPIQIPTIDELKLPVSIKELTGLNNGIVLVTGPTGSGKSTTIASILNTINEHYQKHIITVEDPVEFLFSDKKSLFTQRGLGTDVQTFTEGIKYALRQDPDIIVVGEIRDRDTLENALAAAETGHLVFSTIHTNSAVQTVNRIINMFDEPSRELASERVANCLRATVAQKLIPRVNQGRVPAVEIMSVTPTVQDYILKRNFDEIYNLMKRGEYNSMKTMNSSIFDLFSANLITKEIALLHSDDKVELKQMMGGVFHGSGSQIKNEIV